MKIKGKTIAVTGASGMLGVYICRSLLNSGAKVKAVVRNVQKAKIVEEAGAEIAKADLGDLASLTNAFKDCDAIVSNAALYSVTNQNWDDNYRANKNGTENVYEAAAKNKVKRVIQISTFGIYKFSLINTIDERTEQINGEGKQGGAYRATKQISDKLAWKLAAKYGIDLTAIRPSGIYGARDSNIMPACYFMLKLPVLPIPDFSWPLVYAGDVANAVTASLENDKSIGNAYNTTGDSSNFVSFMRAFKKAAGKGPTIFSLPLGLGLKTSNEVAAKDLNFQNRPFEAALMEVFAEEPEKLN